MSTSRNKALRRGLEELRLQIPVSLTLNDFIKLDASVSQFAGWVEDYATDVGMQILTEDRRPVAPGELADHLGEMLEAYQTGKAEIALFDENVFAGQSAHIVLEIAPLHGGGIHVTMYGDAVFAHEAHHFYQVRDSIRESFPRLPEREKTGRGHPHLMPRHQRRRVVQQWREAKARGVTKAAFCREVIVPGDPRPGISTKTLIRYEREFPEE
jgi:hypothetical protein